LASLDLPYLVPWRREAFHCLGPRVTCRGLAGRLAVIRIGWATNRWFASREVAIVPVQSRVRGAPVPIRAEQSSSRSSTFGLKSEEDEFGVPRLTVRWRVSSGDYGSVVRALVVVGSEIWRLEIGTVSTPSSTGELAEDRWRGVPGEEPTRHAPNEQLSPVLVWSISLAMPGSWDPNFFVASSAVFLASGFEAPTLAIGGSRHQGCR
jgi:hypothetical protein